MTANARKLVAQAREGATTLPAEVTKLELKIAALRSRAQAGGDDMLSPADYERLVQSTILKRDALLTRARSKTNGEAKVIPPIPGAADRIRGLLARLMHTDNPTQAAVVRETLRPFLADGRIVLTPKEDRTAFRGSMVLDGKAYLVDLPLQINWRPRPELNGRL